jgi:AhpD family alkylhydroperoxidase
MGPAIPEETAMQARMNHPVLVLPEAMAALQAMKASVDQSGLPDAIAALAELRASQINGCSVCVDMHAKLMQRAGETSERIIAVAAWREAPYFTEAERSALALAEAVTRMADRPDAVPDEVWAEAAGHFDEKAMSGLLLAIANINVWNRLNAAIRQPVGAWKV